MTSGFAKDVIVVGAGVFGLSVAYLCALSGRKVTVLDAHKIGSGASGGVVGAMSPHTPDEWNSKKQFQYDALVSAKEFWKGVDDHSGVSSGYGRVGRVFPNTDSRVHALSQKRSLSAPSIWGNSYSWNLLSAHDLVADEYANFGLVHDTLSARIYPKLACRSLGLACVGLGVKIHEDYPITSVSDHTVCSPSGDLRGQSIVLAGGTNGFALMDNVYGQTTGAGVKGQSILLDIDLPNAPTIAGEGLYIVPHSNGTVGVGSTSEVTYEDPVSTDHQLDIVLQKAQKLCPKLKDAHVLQRWAGLRPKAKKRTPIVGKLPDLNGIFVAGGGFKIGFGIAHEIARMVTCQINEVNVDIPPTFTPEHHLERLR